MAIVNDIVSESECDSSSSHRRSASAAPGESETTPHALIRTHSGWIEGVRETVSSEPSELAAAAGDAILTWRGVPYATAGRWESPRDVHWDGVLDASEFGPIAPQTSYTWKDTVIGDEDCLNLDIVRPAPERDDTELRQLPVVVFFHGGSYFAGASHTAVIRGTQLSRQLDVVYVSINFRLGVFGYINMQSLASDGQLHLPGSDACASNPAMEDQIQALRWVQRNIAAFGGDPDNVTVMGESAGGAAVAALMTAPAARGLCHRAIMQSSPLMSIHTPAQSRIWARRLIQFAGYLPRHTSIEELRAIPAADLVRAGQQMMWRGGGLRELNTSFGMSIDGTTLPKHPLEAFAAGEQAQIPVLIGTNSDELSAAQVLYVFRRSRAAAARRMIRSYDPDNVERIVSVYGDLGRRSAFAAMLADAIFWAPSVRLAELHSLGSAGAWMYRFDYSPALLRRLGVGAMHAMELAALFGDPQSSKASFVMGDDMDTVTRHMQQAWGNFVWGREMTWPRYEAPTRATQLFSHTPTVVHDPRAEYRRAWDGFSLRGWAGDESTVKRPRPGR